MKYLFYLSTFLLLFSFLSFAQSSMVINKYNGTSDTISFSDIKSISFLSNLVRNGNFSNSLADWTLIGDKTNPYHPEDPGRADFNIKEGMLQINIKNQGISIWSIMVYQKVMFDKNATYDISFDAKSDSAMQIMSNVAQDGGEWTVYSGDKVFNITNTMSRYSYQFKMSVSGGALFQFCLGMLGKRTIYLDNIVIKKI